MNKKSQSITLIIIFIIALLPRLLPPNEFITADELTWVHRSIHFRAALLRGDWQHTFQSSHPGVLTMWLGALGLSLSGADANELAALDRIPVALAAEDIKALARFLPAAKLLLPWVHALLIAAMYPLLTRLFGKNAAFYGAVLAATAPFHIALSRVLHLDALLASLMGLSTLSFLVYLANTKEPKYIFLTGLFAALAALVKTPALFLAPFFFTLYCISILFRRSGRYGNLPYLLTAILFAAFIFVLLFPAMWTHPLETIDAAVGKAVDYAANTDDPDFFMGEVTLTGGVAVYPVTWWFKTTPMVILGIIILLTQWGLRAVQHLTAQWGLRPKHRDRDNLGRYPYNATPAQWGLRPQYAVYALLGYAVAFGAFLTLSIKNATRYLQPSQVALNLVAGVGIAYLVDYLSAKGILSRLTFHASRLTPHTIAGSILTAAACLILVIYHPYYFSYYNPLAGGGAKASDAILVGWGEGLEKAAQYLNAQPDARVVASSYSASFIPFFDRSVVNLSDYNPATVDYFVFYISKNVQRRIGGEIFARYHDVETPAQVIRLHGINYVWIYRNKHFPEILDYIAPRAAAGDAIILPTPSNFADFYRGEMPNYTVAGEDEEITAQLTEIAAQHRRVWYVAYPKFGKKTTYYLQSRGYRLSAREFPDATVYEYQLPDAAAFADPPVWQDAFADFGGKFQLLQYRVTPTAAWRRDFGVTAQWQLTQDAKNYRAFLHLVDEAGHRWGQYDAPLQPRYTVPVIAGTPPGKYELLMGVYRWDSGERLALADGSGTTVSLGKVRVEAAPFPPALADFEFATPAAYNTGAGLRIIGYDFPIATARPGDTLPLTIFWQAAREIAGELLIAQIQIKAEDNVITTIAQPLPDRWRAGEIIRGQYDVLLPAEITADAAQLWVNLGGDSLLLSDIAIDRVARSFTPPAVPHEQTARLGDAVDFIGYEIGEIGATVPITLYWHARQPLETSYTVFVHLLDAAGQVIAQRDTIPVNGARPTTGWASGEYITDVYEIPLNDQAAPRDYQIEIGMYDAATGERLPVYDAAGDEIPERRIMLRRET